jgi:putative ABC transport system ATP-binding protein
MLTSSPSNLLEAKQLTHGFEYTLFENLSITLQEKESIAIVGRSGSGKSTLLHILSSFLKPNEGEVTLLGKDLYTLNEQTIEQLRRYEIGMIFQFHYLFKGMSALANIEVATMLSGEILEEQLLEKLEIKELMHQKIGELSGGQQQRISIARVLSKKPKIIFADEPTGNLDKETASLVMQILLEYINQENACMSVVTHDETIANACQKCFKLEGKKLLIS